MLSECTVSSVFTYTLYLHIVVIISTFIVRKYLLREATCPRSYISRTTELGFKIRPSDSRTHALNQPCMTCAALSQLGSSPGWMASFSMCPFGHLPLCPWRRHPVPPSAKGCLPRTRALTAALLQVFPAQLVAGRPRGLCRACFGR